MSKRGCLRNERGATMVELALVLPVLLTVIFGIMECGRLMLAYTTLADAARAGTRYAIVHGSYRADGGDANPADGPSGPGDTADVEAAAKRIATAAGLSGVNVTVDYPDGSNDIGARVTVTASYTFNGVVGPLVPLINVKLGSTSEGMICY